MKSARGAVLIGAAEDAPPVMVVDGIVFLLRVDGSGAVMTLSATVSGSPVSTGCGFADVIVVADVGAIVGEAIDGGDTDGGGTDGEDTDDGGACGVARTAMVTPKRTMPATATTQVIVVRKPCRRGMRTVAR